MKYNFMNNANGVSSETMAFLNSRGKIAYIVHIDDANDAHDFIYDNLTEYMLDDVLSAFPQLGKQQRTKVSNFLKPALEHIRAEHQEKFFKSSGTKHGLKLMLDHPEWKKVCASLNKDLSVLSANATDVISSVRDKKIKLQSLKSAPHI